ncbi:MAG: hypothetical protein RID53_33800 [Coleofasciculus sp. B1-GNL1-01]|uniref:hypothetical protein n=1 Tax=Coleofasciculus sp. B1-GNL1-01 TaxID=3068484 RepID=UPI0032F3173A
MRSRFNTNSGGIVSPERVAGDSSPSTSRSMEVLVLYAPLIVLKTFIFLDLASFAASPKESDFHSS